MRDVAIRAGVAPSTVSKALRSDPTIPELRRQEIARIAKQLGYSPNPMVAALMSQLHNYRRRADPCQLAWIDLWPTTATRPPLIDVILKGVRARAAELGYGIEKYSASSSGYNPRQLRRMLVSKGQWGFIIPPVPKGADILDLDVTGLAGITIGTSLQRPVLDRVSPNHFQGGLLAFRRMQASGYKRIGLVMSPEMNDRVERKWLGAYLACQHNLPSSQRLPPCIVEASKPEPFLEWCRRHQPDALLTTDLQLAAWKDILPKSRRPAIGLLMLNEVAAPYPGVDYRFEHVGAVAVEILVGQVHRNERGVPAIPHTVEVDACWKEA